MQADSLPAEPPGKPKNSGVGSLSLLQWIFPTQELNLGLLHCRQILYQLSYQGSPYILKNCILILSSFPLLNKLNPTIIKCIIETLSFNFTSTHSWPPCSSTLHSLALQKNGLQSLPTFLSFSKLKNSWLP